MQFKQYPSYKNSGVEWLGDVPEHWSITPLKFAIKNWRNGKWGYDVVEASDDNLVCVRVADFDRQKGVINTEKLTLRNYKGERVSDCLLNENHILIERSGGGENQLVGATVKFSLNIKTVCSNFISLLEIKTNYFDLDFIQYYFDHLYSLNVNKLSIKQTSGIQNLDLKQYVQNHISFPEILEQTQIVLFLDSETTRIDNLIAKQEKLIELLEEQRKSIISHAVTKGLNPNAPMKDSGVEWLGDVPEHWEVFQLKSAIKGWRNGKWGNEPAAENNICCVRVADFDRTKGVINTTKLTYRNYHGENISECILDENSILIERSGGGEKQLVGATVVNTLKQTAVCSNFISLLNINPNRVNIFFLQKCFENLYTRKVNEKSIKQTSGIQNLDLKQYLQNNIAYPSLDEQKSIVSYLDAECKKIDLLVDKQYQLIRKLKNYRTSIISHAVTGKIDVREFGA
jgi:type I restriction enzyme S subunit